MYHTPGVNTKQLFVIEGGRMSLRIGKGIGDFTLKEMLFSGLKEMLFSGLMSGLLCGRAYA